MKLLKVLFVLELALGILWVIPMTLTEDPGLGALLLLIWTCPLHLIFMGIGVYFLVARPETRTVALMVLLTPVALFFLPLCIRVVFGGALMTGVDPFPLTVIAALALPFVTCLVLPHQVAQYVPSCVLKSRWFNVSLIVLLVLLLSPWAVLFAQLSFGEATKDVLLVVLVSALLSLLISIGVLVYSYVGLFQKRDRDQQRLRVAQLVLSLGVTVLALPTTYFVFVVVAVSPG